MSAEEVKPKTCSVERHPYYDKITEWIGSGMSAVGVERAVKEAGYPGIKRETITKHVRECLGGDPKHAAKLLEIVRKAEQGAPRAEIERDFAVAVQKKAVTMLAEDRLHVTTKDGLVAQQLLDRRAEKEKDRAFILDLARLISGAGAPAPDEIIDGEFEEVGELAEGAYGLLAPPEVRDGDPA